MAKARKTTRDPWKTKVWYRVHAPGEFNKADIGTTPASDPELLPGRVIRTSLADLSGDRRDFKKQKQKLDFRITTVKGMDAESEFVGHTITRDYERSLGKRGGSKFYGRFLVKTSDGKDVKVKIVGVAAKALTRSREAEISSRTLDILQKSAKENVLSDFIQNLLFGKLGSQMFTSANKIYPMKLIVISRTEVLS